jgi:hypothetical protein
VHVSGIGADPDSESPYIRARGRGERSVLSKVAGGIDEPLRHQGSCRPIRRSRYGYHPEVVRRVQHSAFSVTACDSCAAPSPMDH